MEFYYDFLDSVSPSLIRYSEDLPQGTTGREMIFIQDDFTPQTFAKSIVLLGIPEDRAAVNNEGTGKNLEELRKEFYNLYRGNWGTQIIDLGDLKVGETFNDTLVILQEIVLQKRSCRIHD